jgi:hypothetical protein
MLIYVNITDRRTDGQTDKHIKSVVRNLTKNYKTLLLSKFLFLFHVISIVRRFDLIAVSPLQLNIIF